MYVLMCFVNLPKTELPRERVFFAFSKIWKHLINNIRRDFMLSESEKATLTGLLNETKKWENKT